MRFAQEHDVHTCLVTDISRLARSALTHDTILERFHVHGITDVVFVHTRHRVATKRPEAPNTTLLHDISAPSPSSTAPNDPTPREPTGIIANPNCTTMQRSHPAGTNTRTVTQ